jgi:hypothetical protein
MLPTHMLAQPVQWADPTLQVGSALQAALVLPVGLEQQVFSSRSTIWLNTV